MEIFTGIHQTRTELIMREVRVGTMLLGVSREKIVKGDEVWIADLQIILIKRFKLPEEYAGYRADQLLTSTMDVSTFEEIK